MDAYLEEMEAWRKEMKAMREASLKKEPISEEMANVTAHPKDFNERRARRRLRQLRTDPGTSVWP
jgi:hypothetical protein